MAKKRPRGKTALLIIDMLNPLDFKEGKQLLKRAIPAARKIAKLKERMKRKGLPVIYVNDNFGKWQSNWQVIFDACAQEDSLGRELASLLKPEEDDYFVLKPKHSGFFSTNLDVLLSELRVGTVILTGTAGNICVLFTANDAHMREYNVIVPRDCIASNTLEDDRYTIRHLAHALDTDTRASAQLRL